jgi:hypothetical protein
MEKSGQGEVGSKGKRGAPNRDAILPPDTSISQQFPLLAKQPGPCAPENKNSSSTQGERKSPAPHFDPLDP